MKCIHCDAKVDRSDWFCPNCKRSPRPADERRRWRWIAIGVASVAGVALSVVGVLRSLAPGVRGDSPTVTIQEAPQVRITGKPTDPAPAATEQRGTPAPAPSVGKDSAITAEQIPSPQEVAQAAGVPLPPVPVSAAAGVGAITVLTVPPVKTFVYLNGGSLLGEAPLRDASIPAGKHTLVLWAPSIGGRSTRKVEVQPGGSVLVVETMHQRQDFQEPKESAG